MATLHVQLNRKNSEAAEGLARETGRTPEQLVNEAFERYVAELSPEASAADWKASIMQAAGLWKDRSDLPDFDELRKSWDRDVWSR